MSDEKEIIIVPESRNLPSQSIFELNPAGMVERAAQMATVLRDIITKQNLSVRISGGEHVRYEGWATMGAMLGFIPREKYVKELEDGSYEAKVELVNVRTGTIVGEGSALCGADEPRWKTAQRYARRSMAITRATGKAYRLGFAWVMALSGYKGTPAEEMPDVGKYFDKDNHEHLTRLKSYLISKQIKEDRFDEIIAEMHEKEFRKQVIEEAISEIEMSRVFAD